MSNLADVKEAVRNVVEPRGAPLRPSGPGLLPNRLQMGSNFNDAVMRLKGAWRSRYTGGRK